MDVNAFPLRAAPDLLANDRFFALATLSPTRSTRSCTCTPMSFVTNFEKGFFMKQGIPCIIGVIDGTHFALK
ncbi:hypothetical protein BC832DRAFT_550838 [Gaertneriomyces semiglobifer]|nr:hypothetical protein BC832DRAFT_550838 [Gaertneriomyces semiglobifer]